MLVLWELEQFVTFCHCRTLSKAAQTLHISQPTLTRTMKHVEETFGVPLFIRGKNKIMLNETGKKAAEYARALLASAETAVEQVQAFDRSLHTITVEACAPAPLWFLLPALSSEFPDMALSSRLSPFSEISRHIKAGVCEIGVLPEPVWEKDIRCISFLEEHLSVCVPKNHSLACCQSLSFSQLNGFNCLLKSQIGFWDEMCRKKMPASRFLVQTNDFEFEELVRESSLPCFTTDLAGSQDGLLEDRIFIPITDPEANVTYFLIFSSAKKEYENLAGRLSIK